VQKTAMHFGISVLYMIKLHKCLYECIIIATIPYIHPHNTLRPAEK